MMLDSKKHIPDRVLRTMGYFSNFRGMMNRYLREQEHWDEHLQQTRKFISDAISRTEHRNVVVLGSGWLLDIPLEELSERFEKVILVDIWHPAQVRHKMTKLPNVELKYMDLSGNTVMKAYEVANRNKTPDAGSLAIEEIFPDPIQLPEETVFIFLPMYLPNWMHRSGITWLQGRSSWMNTWMNIRPWSRNSIWII